MTAGETVRRAVEAGELEAARRLVGWHLVSRDTSVLDQSQVAAAAIESLAENANDSIVAPLFFYAVAGLPGALAYRFINTCDAMLGYRDAKREWLGKCSARVDDLANWIPARLTATMIILAGVCSGGDLARGIRTWFRDARADRQPQRGPSDERGRRGPGRRAGKERTLSTRAGRAPAGRRRYLAGKTTGLEYGSDRNLGDIGDQNHDVRSMIDYRIMDYAVAPPHSPRRRSHGRSIRNRCATDGSLVATSPAFSSRPAPSADRACC